MNTDPQCHPTVELLIDYVQGELSAGWSIAISAHLELCKRCTQKADELESNTVVSWLQDSTMNNTQDFSHLIDNIIDQPQTDIIGPSESRQSPISEIHMLDHSFTLPRILAKAANEGLVWKLSLIHI